MPVTECKIEARPAAAGAVEQVIAAGENPCWVMLEDRGSGRVWTAGYFSSRSGGGGAWRRLAKAMNPAWLVGGPRWRNRFDPPPRKIGSI
jgi:hypothetical protein